MLDAQDERLVDYLERHPDIEPAALAAHFKVSERAIRTYVCRANDALGACARIVKHRGDGYALEVYDDAVLAELRANDPAARAPLPTTPEARVNYLLNDLLSRTGWITIDDLSSILFVSRNAIARDLKQVEGTLAHFGLSLEKRPHYGVRVAGSEMSRRLCLANLALDGIIGSDVIGATGKSTLDTISSCVSRVLDEEAFQVNSATYQNLLVHLAVAIERVRQDCYVPMEPEHLDRLRATNEYAVAGKVAAAISQAFDLELPEEEVGYIAIHLASKQSLYTPGSENDQGLVISDEVWDTVSRMLECVWQAFHFDFRNDLELRMNLARHIVPLSVRLRYRMKIDNPLLDDIVSRFPLAYSMALDSSSVLAEEYGSKLSEDEIGYLALAFALAIERQKTELPRKNILVVCASGQGSAKLLEWRYRQEFGTLLDRIVTCDVAHLDRIDLTGIDYVFTTVPLGRELPVPVREVAYFLDADDARRVRELLQEEADQGDPVSYFDRRLFIPHVEAVTKEQIIEVMCRRVHEVRAVPDDFQELVLRRERLAQTCFGNLVAMPHPAEAVSEDTFVTVALLDAPVAWDGQEVQAVFLVSVSRARNKDLDRFYRCMASMLTSPEAIQRLVGQQDWETLVELLDEYGHVSEKE